MKSLSKHALRDSNGIYSVIERLRNQRAPASQLKYVGGGGGWAAWSGGKTSAWQSGGQGFEPHHSQLVGKTKNGHWDCPLHRRAPMVHQDLSRRTADQLNRRALS